MLLRTLLVVRFFHTLDIVKNVGFFSCSPVDDYVILSAADFKVDQMSGSNKYGFNCDDLIVVRSSHLFQIVDRIKSSSELNQKTTSLLEMKPNNAILQNQKSGKVSIQQITELQSPVFEVLSDTESTGYLSLTMQIHHWLISNTSTLRNCWRAKKSLIMSLEKAVLDTEGGRQNRLVVLKIEPVLPALA